MNKVDEILKLKELLNSGVITEKEFVELKKNLLEGSSSEITSKKVEISADEKECPNCNVIINKNHQKCEFCDYDFESKQVKLVNKDLHNDRKSRKKELLFAALMLFLLFGMWFFVDYMPNKNIDKDGNLEINQANIPNVTNTESATNELSNEEIMMQPAAGSDEVSDFDFGNLKGEEIYKANGIEQGCNENGYSINENEINQMRFIVSKNSMIVKGVLVDLILNTEDVNEVSIKINSLIDKTTVDRKSIIKYDATCTFNVGSEYFNRSAVLNIMTHSDEIVSLGIIVETNNKCGYVFKTEKVN